MLYLPMYSSANYVFGIFVNSCFLIEFALSFSFLITEVVFQRNKLCERKTILRLHLNPSLS